MKSSSPTNKVPGQGQNLYPQKQQEMLAAGASLVEIDVTRVGRRVLSVPQQRVPPRCCATCQAMVRRARQPEKAEVDPMPLDRTLPWICVPLRQTDADVALDLQALVELCCANGCYDDLEPRSEPSPALDAADAARGDQWLREKGVRPGGS